MGDLRYKYGGAGWRLVVAGHFDPGTFPARLPPGRARLALIRICFRTHSSNPARCDVPAGCAALGSVRQALREIFEAGRRRAALVTAARISRHGRTVSRTAADQEARQGTC